MGNPHGIDSDIYGLTLLIILNSKGEILASLLLLVILDDLDFGLFQHVFVGQSDVRYFKPCLNLSLLHFKLQLDVLS
jgi:hypothetical protein